ncbi:hypothetical protein ACU4GD_22740 [Cupriavidus basilensis]
MARICLNMIVKDEAPVVTRCLQSVKPWIDHWIIVDTGSSDGTQGGHPSVHEPAFPARCTSVRGEISPTTAMRPLALAKDEMTGADDYLLFIDADETLQMDLGFRWPAPSADGYQFRCELNGWQYLRNARWSRRVCHGAGRGYFTNT